jgi:predicted lipoprotein
VQAVPARRPATPTTWAVAAAILGAVGGGGCKKPAGGAADADPFAASAFLNQVGAAIVIPTYQRFTDEIAALASAIEESCAALGTVDETARRLAAQEAWHAAMMTWQRAELWLFGPAAASNHDLRDHIYSWPIVSTCAVDQDVMLRYQDPSAYDITLRLVNRRGLDALEYVLFVDTLEVSCPPQAAPAGWVELFDADKKSARCGFAAAAAADLAKQAQILVDAWLPAGGDYLGDLVSAGQSGSPFATARDAVNAVSDGLFYLDVATKDKKIAMPAGLLPSSCGAVGTPCPADVELPTARASLAAIRANLLGFQMVLSGRGADGAPGVGFVDFLQGAGAGALAARMTASVEAALGAVDAVEGDLASAVTLRPAQVATLHAAIKAITDDLKGDFLTLLMLRIPDEGAGDSD